MVSRDLVGRIMLDRKIMNWRWYDDANTFRVFIHLILCAVFAEEIPYHDTVLKRGQWLTTRKQLSAELGISEQAVRTALKHLESTGEITIKSTNNKTLITVENYSFYQDTSTVANQRSTNDQPTTNQLNNNANNNNKKKNNKKEKVDEVEEFISKCPEEMHECLKEFAKMRKTIKKPLTAYALQRACTKAKNLANGDVPTMIAIFDQSTERSYQGVFPLAEENKPKSQENIFSDDIYDMIDA